MLLFTLNHVLVLGFLHYIDGQRKITSGHSVLGVKRYMAYFVQALTSTPEYDNWICGGTIVTRFYILTSAACVEDVRSMYAITGTKRYIKHVDLFENICAIKMSKKIVFSCVPKDYEFNYSHIEKWSYNDIAIVKVETPYDFDDEAYVTYCDYKPNSIQMNFDLQNEKEGTDVMVLGFGHKNVWRHTYDVFDWNQLNMKYATTKILNPVKCEKVFRLALTSQNIQKYMFCTNGSGHINEDGRPSIHYTPYKLPIQPSYRKHTFKMLSTRKNINSTFNRQARRQGFCQNDHGGPLVAWINNEETVLGVASIFRVNMYQNCTGPYLYTSTARNKLFIECIIYENSTRRNDKCNQPASKRGFSIIRKYIMWNENIDE